MQEKEARPRQTAYSYSQLAFTKAALAPGQNSIGTGGQDWIGSNTGDQCCRCTYVSAACLASPKKKTWIASAGYREAESIEMGKEIFERSIVVLLLEFLIC